MYCPKCAAQCSSEQKFCRTCGFELHAVSQILNQDSQENESDQSLLDSLVKADERANRWKPFIERFGIISIMLALMVGCIIPISMGLNAGVPNIPLILVVAGIAGLLLFGGIILVVFADSESKSSGKARKSSPKLQRGEETNKLLTEAQNDSFTNFSVTDRTTDLLPTPDAAYAQKTADSK
ncbi:MAG TPA: zinc ribbon domain-containing protein [Blastocatellia bacterium]|nr:zinc ribbon domain-containing protein [Blastocatellia bacterium]